MRVGFIGIGNLGRDAAEVMAQHYDVVGFDIKQDIDTTVNMSKTLAEAVQTKDIVFVAVPTPHHKDYDGRYPTGTVKRKDQLQKLLHQVQGQMNMMKSVTSIQKRSTAASYQVAHSLGKAMAPYSQSETVKECMLGTVKTLFPDKKDIREAIQRVQLSRKTCANSIETIAEGLTEKVVNDLRECNSF